jgi:hypothetical protein
MSEIAVNRLAVREMVEDVFRSQLLFHLYILHTQPHLTSEQGQEETIQYAERLLEQTYTAADLMPSEQAVYFRRIVNDEYSYLAHEFQRNPVETSRRFGVVLNGRVPAPSYRRKSIGEAAVRTSVRAAVRELIFSIFRRRTGELNRPHQHSTFTKSPGPRSSTRVVQRPHVNTIGTSPLRSRDN